MRSAATSSTLGSCRSSRAPTRPCASRSSAGAWWNRPGVDVIEQLEPLPEDWDRALAVVAHPDDLEYGGAAAIARWTSQGKHVAYLLASRGEAGIDTMEPAKAAEVRTAEQ